MLEPCYEHCYLRYGKQYTTECDDKCNYAKAVKEKKELIENAIIFPQTIGDITFYSKEELTEWVEEQQQINKLSILSGTIPDEIIDKWNSIGCTSFRLTADELKEVVEKEYEVN